MLLLTIYNNLNFEEETLSGNIKDRIFITSMFEKIEGLSSTFTLDVKNLSYSKSFEEFISFKN